MINHSHSKDILTDQENIGKVTEFKYLRQTRHLKDTTKEEIYAGLEQPGAVSKKKKKEILRDRQLPFHSKKKKKKSK